MIAAVRNKFDGGLDLDSSYYEINRNSYADALNITKDAIAGNADRVISNIVGNRIINFDYTSPGTIIGLFPFTLRNTVIIFRYSPTGFDGIYQYDNSTRQITKIFECLTDSDENILNFSPTGKITGVNVFPRTIDEGDLLFFLDSLGRPTVINIQKFIAGEYTPVTRDVIDVGRRPPLYPPSAVYSNDTGVASNFLTKKLFRFKYRWVYDDNEKSTYGPISEVALPANILDPDFTNIQTNNNLITVSVNTGPQNVKGIELAVSVANNSDVFSRFGTVTYVDKVAGEIDDDTTFAIAFYNDGTYPTVSDDESLLLFDYVPDLANAQEMPNGNVVVYSGITEGYDRTLDPNVVITVLTVPAGEGTPIGGLNAIVTIVSDTSLQQIFTIDFSGVPAVGTVVEVKIQTVSGGAIQVGATYTTILGDIASSVAAGISASFNSLGVVFSAGVVGNKVSVITNIIFASKKVFFSLIITPPASSADNNSIPTWPFFQQRQLGIVYYDQKGKSNGVLYNSQVVFPNYNESGGAVLLPYINVKIYHTPPDWAYSYQIVFTKDPTEFLYLETSNPVDGSHGVLTDTDFIYFNITNLGINQTKNPTTTNVVSWTFQDGDRMRLIKRPDPFFIYGPSYDTAVEGIVVEPSISDVTQTGQTFVKIRKSAPFTAEFGVFVTDFYIIQLYRPGQITTDQNAVYYECGVQYPILFPTTSDRAHGGQVTDQNGGTPAEINIYSGDCYFRVREEYLSDDGVATFFVQDLNFVDFYISAVNSIDGRPWGIDINAKRSYYSTFLRFSREYEPNSNINGLNRFFPNNTQQYDYAFGDVMRLKVRGSNMRVYQKFRIGNVSIFNQLVKQAATNAVTVATDQLLNQIYYYAYDGGIGTAATSLASFNNADYCVDNIKAKILRISQDGVIPISDLYHVNSWAVENIPLRQSPYFIYGAFDQKINNYIIALEQAVQTNVLVVATQGVTRSPSVIYYYFTLTGIGSTGNEISVFLRDSDNVERTYSYTLLDGDDITSALTNIKSLINADTFFVAINYSLNSNAGLKITQTTTPVVFNPLYGNTTIQYNEDVTSPAQTLSFSEEENSFDSFLSYHPEAMCTLGILLCSAKNGDFYTHDNPVYNHFYGVDYESTWTPVFNENGLEKKTFLAITQAANTVWDCPEITSQLNTYGTTSQLTTLVAQEFKLLEGQFHAAIKRDMNSAGGKINGSIIKGNWLAVKFRVQNASSLINMNIVSLKYIDSPLNK